MGIIGRNHPKQGSSSGTTVIAAGTELVGNLALVENNLHVDGRVKGEIESKAEVIIGAPGHIEGQIRAERVLISGSFDGSIDAERLEIVATGTVSGEVTVGQLVVESGAHFNGVSRIRGDEPPRQLTHEGASSNHDEADGQGQEREAPKKKSKPDTAS